MIRRIALGLLVLLGVAAAPAGEPRDARALMDANFLATKVSSFEGKVSMVLTTAAGQERTRKMVMWQRLRGTTTESQVLMRFEEPGDIKGTSFLQLEHPAGDDDIWIYLPALGKVRRMVASNKRDSFFGTDFAYGDVVLPPVERWEHAYVRAEALDGDPCDVIESKPRDSKTRDDSGYSRKVIWLDAATHVERKVEYYDLDGRLLKTQRALDIKQVENDPPRFLPMRREMLDHQTGHRTLYRFDGFALDAKLKDAFFTTRTLERQ